MSQNYAHIHEGRESVEASVLMAGSSVTLRAGEGAALVELNERVA